MSIAAREIINRNLDRDAINKLTAELRKQRYADIKHAHAPRISEYQDYDEFLLDRECYENALLENDYLMPPERQDEIRAIRERREKEFQKQERDYYLGWVFKIIFVIGFVWLGFYLGK